MISNMHNKFGKNTLKTIQSLCPQVNVNADANDDDAELKLQ